MPEYPGDEWRTKWHTLDVAQANALLDKIGLDKKDASGMRLRADGKGPLRIEVNTTNSFVNFSKIAEMIVQQWKKVGITLDIKDMERATWEQNRNANKQQICMWSNGGTELIYLYPIHALPVQENSQVGPSDRPVVWDRRRQGHRAHGSRSQEVHGALHRRADEEAGRAQQARPGDLEDLC